MKKAFVLAALLCLHTPALAAECYTKSVPPASLLEVIARQESGLNPLAVNIAGKSYHPATREEAERLIRQAITAGQSFDVGKMQINSWWMERYIAGPTKRDSLLRWKPTRRLSHEEANQVLGRV